MSRAIDLSGKHAVVTGASRGVGRATALALAEAGARVGVACRSREEEAQAVAEACRAVGGAAWVHVGDLTDPEVVEALFSRARDEAPALDVFVGNHGIWESRPVSLTEMSDDRWRHTLAVNLDSLFFACRAAARHIGNGGRIVLVSSTAAQRGEAFHGDYAASKGALISLVKSLCVELGPRGVTVNAVAPGWVDTEMVADALSGAAGVDAAARIPLGRVARAEDVAGPILFLCSDLAAHVTGEVLNVNGGSVLAG